MSRKVIITFFKFEELSEESKQVAIDNHRRTGIDNSYIYDDAIESIKKFHGVFSTKEGRRSWLEVQTDHINDNILNLKGLRLQKYIWNNFKHSLYKGKYYHYKGNTPKKIVHPRITSIFYPNRNYWGNYYYSRVQLEHSCVLTGVCYDDSLLNPIYEFLDNYKSKSDYYSYMDFDTLMNDCISNLKKDLESEEEYLNSDEAIIETLSSDEYEFTKDGNIFYK